MKKIMIALISIIFLFATTMPVAARNNHRRFHRDHSYRHHHNDHYGYYLKYPRHHYFHGKRHDFRGHYSRHEWNHYREHHRHELRHGRYYRGPKGGLIFGFTDEFGNCFFFSIGR
ncbi:MAG: hypothetical protein ACFFG0_00915 [Candidatus Thorarchaeota archaeon]